MTSTRYHLSSALSLLAVFVLLSVLLHLQYPGDHLFSLKLLQPSIDVWLLLVALALTAAWGKRLLACTTALVWLVFLLLRLIGIGDVVAPMYLNRPFNLYLDSAYIFSLFDLLQTSSDSQGKNLVVVIAAVIIFGFMVLSWVAWRTAAKALVADKRVRLFFMAGSLIILSMAFQQKWDAPTRPIIFRLGQEIHSAHQQHQLQQALINRMEETAGQRGDGPFSLAALGGTDILLFMIESYGRTVYTKPQYRQAMQATMTNLAEKLTQHGFMAVSSYLVSPTYGGISRLAHGTLEFGFKAHNDLEYKALLGSTLPPMASLFGQNGYRTVSVMPGTRFAYPEGSAYGYHQAYYAEHFDYHGPTFGWAPMADQFVLDWVHRRELVKPAQPLFIRYVLVSSHASYSVQPTFIADWDSIGNGDIYNALPPIRYPISWPNLKNAGNAYLRSLDYDFHLLGDYLTKYVIPDTLIIIMGDHQPNHQLTEDGESFSVPVHIISGNGRLLDSFRKRGYTSGLMPSQPLPHAGMETFLQNFLDDFK